MEEPMFAAFRAYYSDPEHEKELSLPPHTQGQNPSISSTPPAQPSPPFSAAPPVSPSPSIPVATPQPNPFSDSQFLWNSPNALYQSLFENAVAVEKFRTRGNWVRPEIVIRNVCPKTERAFQSRELIKRDGRYYVLERNGREILVGVIDVPKKYVVNPKSDDKFDALLVIMRLNENSKTVKRVIPYEKVVKGDVMPSLEGIERNPDCPIQYIKMAFFQELQDCTESLFLHLPTRSGWWPIKEKAMFAHMDNVVPQLRQYYSTDILNRVVIKTKECLANAADNLAKLLPATWEYKLLLTIRITSLLLYFYAEAGFQPDQCYVIEPRSDYNAQAVIAILKNQNPNSTTICELTECKTTLQRELQQMNDGMALFRDASYAEDKRKREAGLNVLLQDLQNNGGVENASRHLIAIISNNPGTISSEYPAYFLTIDCLARIDKIHVLQEALSRFDYLLIQELSDSDRTDNLVSWALKQPKQLDVFSRKEDYQQSEQMMCATMEILKRNGLLSDQEQKDIINYLERTHYEGCTSDQRIVNEFWNKLSHFLCQNKFVTITNQYGQPYYDKEKLMVILDSECVNMQAKLLEQRVLYIMITTRKRDRLLRALHSCGQLHATNGNKRLLQVEVRPGVMESIYFYSFPRIYLTQRCQHKLQLLAQADFLFRKQEYPEGFLPIVSVDEKYCAGRVVDEATDEAESIYVSGQTRSGKTHFLVQQAVIRAASGERVIVIDQTGAFTSDELRKHLPEAIINQFFSLWDIRRNGLPVNLLSLEHCDTLPDKKDRLLSIFSVAARISGDVQEKTIRRRLSAIVRAIESDRVSTLPETLQFFDEDNPAQADIRDRLESVFDDLEGVSMLSLNWREFLRVQKSITVISMGADGIRKSKELTDMLLASIYAFMQHEREERIAIILDELDDLCLDKDGPINKTLRKGGKHKLSLMLASQKYSVENDRLGQLIGNCGLKIFFHPEDGDISDIAKHIGCDRSMLARLEQGECVAYGGFYSRNKAKNRHQLIAGKTYLAEQFMPEKGHQTREQSPE